MFYEKDYPKNYNKEERLCFDKIREIAASAGAGALVVENGSGYVLAEVSGDVTEEQKNTARSFNSEGNLLILDFVSERERSKGDVFHV